MSELKYGGVTIQLAEKVELPEKAGNLSAIEVSRVPRSPKQLSGACEDAGHSLQQAGPKFLVPPHLTTESLIEKGRKGRELQKAIREVGRCYRILKQGSLLLDAEAFDQLRELNDLVKVQVKRRPELKDIFEPLIEFFAKGSRLVEEGTSEETDLEEPTEDTAD